MTRRAAQTEQEQRSDSSSRVGSDALAVGLGYLASFAYPLVSLPLLTRAFGPHLLGQFIVALTLLQFVVYITDFGFQKSALRRVALARTAQERSKVLFSTLAATAALWAAAAIVLMIIVALVPGMRSHWQLYALGLGIVGLGAMYPTWFLQGIGRVKTFAVLTSISRLVALACLLLTVHGPGDTLPAMLWQQLPQALSGLISLVMILGPWRAARWTRVRIEQVREALRDSWPMFLANVSQVAIAGSGAVVLGIVSTPTHVAYYGAAERFANAARGVMNGVVDSMLPRMTRSDDSSRSMHRLILFGTVAVYGLAGVCLIVFAPLVVPWYLGETMRPTVPVTQVLGVSLVLAGIVQALVLRATAMHHFTTVARVSAIVAVVHVALLFPAGAMWNATGAACVAVLSEALLAGLYLLDLRSSRRAEAALP